ncbi:hypothetical protein GCM10020255_017730 [Rhodococcus baikonurensis]
MSDRAPVFEEAGYSLFGPTALNIAAPDEGNVHMLAHVANEAQKQQFLAPLASGDAVGLRHDRACARSRIRPFGLEHPRGEGSRRLEDQR